MIVFKKVRYKNFLSTGQQFIEIDLDKAPTTLVIGDNGSGKSTILDAMCFGLFSKPFRAIKKDQLVNTINEKECVVEVEFNIGQNQYKIIRGIRPNTFEIWCDGDMLNQDAAQRDYQKHLEQNILKLNFRSFTQVVILGNASFVPFMQLRARYRREVVEEILDIEIFSKLNLMFREKQKLQDELIKNSDFTGADLTNTYASNSMIYDSFFHNTNLSGAFFEGANIQCGLSGTTPPSMWSACTNFENTNFENTNLSRVKFFNLDISDSKIHNTKFIQSKLIKVNFPEQISADFTGAVMPQSRLHGDLSNVTFSCYYHWCTDFSFKIFSNFSLLAFFSNR